MTMDPTIATVPDWRAELPALAGRAVLLREPGVHDLGSLVDLLSIGDATRFGVEEPISEAVVQRFIERVAHDRKTGTAFTYAIRSNLSRAIVGLIQVRQLDPGFESADWECTIAPSARGT